MPPADPVAALTWRPLPPTGVVVVVVSLVAWFVAGPSASASAAIGGMVVLAFFLGGLWAVRKAVLLAGPASMMAAFMTFSIQVLGLLIVLFLLRDSAWLDRGWFAIAATAAILVWQVAQTIGYVRARHPIYGVHSQPPAPNPPEER